MHIRHKTILALLSAAGLAGGADVAGAQQGQRGATSYLPVGITEPFASTMARMKAAKSDIEAKQTNLLAERYDLINRAAAGVTMSRGKALEEGFASSCHLG